MDARKELAEKLSKCFTEVREREVRIKPIIIDVGYIFLVIAVIIFSIYLIFFMLHYDTMLLNACGICEERFGRLCYGQVLLK